jgi:hypothetical protein
MVDTITKTDEEIEREVLSILSFHKGKDKRISRWELVERIFGREAAANRSNNNSYDRKIRSMIEKNRDSYLIVSSSGLSGYWLAADLDDVELIAQEYVDRSRKMEERARNIRRRGRDQFGSQIPLFKPN